VVDVALYTFATTPDAPATESAAKGEVVPIPTNPLEFHTPFDGKKALLDTVSAVVDAYVNIEANVVEVAVKYEPIILLPSMSPPTDSLCPGDVVPIPILEAKYAFPVVVAPPDIVRPPF
jgi:hypothetical protein